MANHKSALKRIRQTETRRIRNRYYAVTMRNALKKIRATNDKEVALEMQPKLYSMIDKLAKKNVIHNNKAANLKSKIAKHIASL